MNFNQFINQPIINKNEEKGIVTSFDETYITVKYQDKEITYNKDTAFVKNYLMFLDDKYNVLIQREINHKQKMERDKELLFRKVRKEHRDNLKAINDAYVDIRRRNNVIKYYFGSDFKYKPYEEFMKKYKNIVNQKKDSFFYELNKYLRYN